MEKTLRILIIEDSEDDTLLLVRRLERGGSTPIWKRVDTLQSLRAALAEEIWDIAFWDYSLQGLGIPNALALVNDRGLDLPFILLFSPITLVPVGARVTVATAAHEKNIADLDP